MFKLKGVTSRTKGYPNLFCHKRICSTDGCTIKIYTLKIVRLPKTTFASMTFEVKHCSYSVYIHAYDKSVT